MKIIIFGTGQIYMECKMYISDSDEVVGFLDNNQKLWGTKVDGIIVYKPEELIDLHFDKVILMSDYALEMKMQLINLKCKKKKIIHYLEYIEAQSVEKIKIPELTIRMNENTDRCLVITTDLAYNGGAIAAFYAALAMQKKGYMSTIATPRCDSILENEIKKKGIGIIVYRNLSHAKRNELHWIDNFQYIIVNTLQMSCCAIEIAKKRKISLWIHEPHNLYNVMSYWKDDIQEGIDEKNLTINAVSSIARANFLHYFRESAVGVLPYGIPDEYEKKEKNKIERLTFAMIGLISEQKGQDIFLDAIEKLDIQKDKATFLVIGKNLHDSYGCMIEEKIQKKSDVLLLGELSHDEVIRQWKDIDVLVVASREDMLPIVATEAMMMGKTCILSNVTGTVDYIKDYESGLIFSVLDSDELAERMQWCINHKDELDLNGKSAREVYEKNFSMDIFAENLEKALK